MPFRTGSVPTAFCAPIPCRWLKVLLASELHFSTFNALWHLPGIPVTTLILWTKGGKLLARLPFCVSAKDKFGSSNTPLHTFTLRVIMKVKWTSAMTLAEWLIGLLKIWTISQIFADETLKCRSKTFVSVVQYRYYSLWIPSFSSNSICDSFYSIIGP